MKFRTFLVGLSALSIAFAAAFFSVTGLSKLFAGASLAVMLMAGTLEAGKLIAASFLYEYWDKINTLLKTYLVIGVIVLIFITSLGIYGFLTSAYQKTAEELAVIDSRVEVVELKQERYNDQLVDLRNERQTLSESINELTSGLSNNVIQYENEDGEIITTTSSATRNVLNEQLSNAQEQRNIVSQRIEVLSDSLTSLDIQKLNIQQESDVASEIGPLKYLAEITGKEMSFIVNIFALLIVFVFDPLAVTLVIAFNTALRIDKNEKIKKNIDRKNYKIYQDKPSDRDVDGDTNVDVSDTELPDKVQVPSAWIEQDEEIQSEFNTSDDKQSELDFDEDDDYPQEDFTYDEWDAITRGRELDNEPEPETKDVKKK